MSDFELVLQRWVEAEREDNAASTATLLTDHFVDVGPVGLQLVTAARVQRLESGAPEPASGLR